MANNQNPNITVEVVRPKQPEVSKELAAKIIDKIIVARIGMLMKAPFFGTLATRLVVRAADDMPTAATDGKFFYYNHEFMNKLTNGESIFLFGHEVLHVVYDHMGRRGDRIPELWNIACDYAVNLDLVENKIGDLIKTVPVLYDRQYLGMGADEIYDLLEKKYKEKNKENQDAIQKMLDQMIDQHIDPSNCDGDTGPNGKKNGNVSPDGSIQKMTQEERERARNDFKEAVLNAARNVEAGTLPLGVQRLIQSLTDSKLDWRALLQTSLSSTIVSDYTFTRPSRTGWDIDAILQGTVTDGMISIACAIDLSGSIGHDQARDFLSEIKGIMGSFTGYEIDVWTFDTKVYGHKKYTSDNLDDIAEYELQGGGGTNFQCNWDFMIENDIKPDRFIMFTDGYGEGWGDPDYVETLWILHSNDPKMVPTHGLAVQYE